MLKTNVFNERLEQNKVGISQEGTAVQCLRSKEWNSKIFTKNNKSFSFIDEARATGQVLQRKAWLPWKTYSELSLKQACHFLPLGTHLVVEPAISKILFSAGGDHASWSRRSILKFVFVLTILSRIIYTNFGFCQNCALMRVWFTSILKKTHSRSATLIKVSQPSNPFLQ